jgi:hypothetical protein
MWATFCDDVRQEVGNKLSFLGVYGPNLIVHSFPTTLVKLCCVMTVRTPANQRPRSVIFKLLRDEEVIFQADLSPADLTEDVAVFEEKDKGPVVFTISTVAQVIGLPVTQHGFLRARALVDGKELRGGALELQAMEVAH